MINCLAKCAAESPWAIYLPLAHVGLSVLNGLLRVPAKQHQGIGKALGWANTALDRIAFHSRHDAKGTLKVPLWHASEKPPVP